MKITTFFRLALAAPALLLAPLLAPLQAQTYKTLSVPSYATVAPGDTNNLGFDNATGGANLTAVKLPKNLASGLTLSHKFIVATGTLASVVFVYQGSIDGTNFHNVPASALKAHIPASAASGGNTNIVYSTNFSQASLQGWNWLRLAGTTNGCGVDMTSVLITAGYWDP